MTPTACREFGAAAVAATTSIIELRAARSVALCRSPTKNRGFPNEVAAEVFERRAFVLYVRPPIASRSGGGQQPLS